jgi:hypothetical protein
MQYQMHGSCTLKVQLSSLELELCNSLSFKHHFPVVEVRDDLKLPGDSGEVPIFEWSGWRSDSCCEIFSLLDGKNKLFG